MANSIFEEGMAVCGMSALRPPARVILLLLAYRASPTTRLAWLGHTKLREVSGYSETAVRTAIAELAVHGAISVWQRPGRVPLYCVHPHGRSALLAFDKWAAEEHLRKGQFSAAHIAEACGWLTDMHCSDTAAPQLESYPHPHTSRGGGNSSECATPAPHAGHPLTSRGPTPATDAGDNKLNQYREECGADAQAELVAPGVEMGLAEGQDGKQGAQPLAKAATPQPFNWRAHRADDPQEVFDLIQTRRCKLAARLADMPHDEALAEISKAQRQAGPALTSAAA